MVKSTLYIILQFFFTKNSPLHIKYKLKVSILSYSFFLCTLPNCWLQQAPTCHKKHGRGIFARIFSGLIDQMTIFTLNFHYNIVLILIYSFFRHLTVCLMKCAYYWHAFMWFCLIMFKSRYINFQNCRWIYIHFITSCLSTESGIFLLEISTLFLHIISTLQIWLH